jgi:hypothetical protein
MRKGWRVNNARFSSHFFRQPFLISPHLQRSTVIAIRRLAEKQSEENISTDYKSE